MDLDISGTVEIDTLGVELLLETLLSVNVLSVDFVDDLTLKVAVFVIAGTFEIFEALSVPSHKFRTETELLGPGDGQCRLMQPDISCSRAKATELY